MDASTWAARMQRSSDTLKKMMVRCQDMRRRGLSGDEYALVITNDEGLAIIDGMLEHNAVEIGATQWMRDALLAGQGWAISGRLNFNGYMVCVKR